MEFSRYPTIVPQWQRDCEHVSTCFAYPAAIRNLIYTTHALESVNRSVRKVIKTHGAFPTDEAAWKLTFLALRKAQTKWTQPLLDWNAALNHFTILLAQRMTSPVLP